MTNPTRKPILQMKQLNKTESIIYIAGGLLMVAGCAANVFRAVWAPYVYTVGAIAFVLMQLRQRYEGSNFIIRRLYNMAVFSDFCFLLSALLMFAGQNNLFNLPIMFYVKYVYGNWVITLLVGAILQLYANHRIGRELKKEEQQKQ